MPGDFRLGDWLVQPSLGRVSKDGATAQGKLVDSRVDDLMLVENFR